MYREFPSKEITGDCPESKNKPVSDYLRGKLFAYLLVVHDSNLTSPFITVLFSSSHR